MKVSSKVIGTGITNAATPYGRRIVAGIEAYAYAQCREDDGRPNRSACVDKIHTAFSGRPPVSEPWCAKIAWVVADAAAQSGYGKGTVLPKTAGARDMLERSRRVRGLTVDETPGVGAVFYRRSSAPGATGHIGIVKGWDNSTLYTVEGNVGPEAGGGVWWAFYDRKDLPGLGMRFIHVERQFGERETGGGILSAGADTIGMLLLLSAGIGYFVMRGRS